MPHYNPMGKGSLLRGFDALSKELGHTVWDQILYHDDGQRGYGGTRAFGVGGQGSGKTTLNTKFARKAYYIDGFNKSDFFRSFEQADSKEEWLIENAKSIKPETILWRGREFDSWNVLAPDAFKRCYPDEVYRPLRVHVHKKSTLTFEEHDEVTGEINPIKNLDIKPYNNVQELYNNMIHGGNNIIYPPIRHFMSLRLKDSINTKRNVSKKDKKYLSPETNYLIERDVFLFEIFEFLYRANFTGTRRWYNAIIDESHDLFRANAPDIYYWIIECMVDVLVDTRKHNLSLSCMTHALNLIDYRILERASHFIWLRGAKPSGSYSMVDTRLIKKLKTGQGVIESCMDGKIGGFTFDRIPHNQSRLVVNGMVEAKELSVDIADDEFEELNESEDEE